MIREADALVNQNVYKLSRHGGGIGRARARHANSVGALLAAVPARLFNSTFIHQTVRLGREKNTRADSSRASITYSV